MAIIDVTYANDPTAFNIHTCQAGNAAQMLTFLDAELAAASDATEGAIADLKLSGTGAGPNWEAVFVTAADSTTPVVALNQAAFVCAVGSNPTQVREFLLAALAVLLPLSVNKVEIAGAGLGTIYMGVALCTVAGPG